MKHNFKKILSIVLAAVICLSAFPFTVLAETTAHTHTDEVMPACPICLENEAVSKTGRVNPEATCREAAGEWYVCATPHEYGAPQEFIKPYEGSVAHHSNPAKVVHGEAKDATCVEEGVLEYWYCPECDTYYKSKEMLDSNKYDDEAATIIAKDDTAHVFDDAKFEWKDGIEAKCGVNGGVKLYACQREDCNYVKEVVVEGKDHSWKYFSHGEEVGCLTETTVTEKCEDCGATRTVEGLGWKHALVVTQAVAKTCTEAGNEVYYTCVLCGKYFMHADEGEEGAIEMSFVSPEGRNGWAIVKEVKEGAWIVPASHGTLVKYGANDATCTENGNEAYSQCPDCGEYLDANGAVIEKDSWIIPATGHAVKFVEAVDATCTKDGNVAYYVCDCGEYFVAVEAGDAEQYTDVKVLYNGKELTVKNVKAEDVVDAATGHVFGEVVPAFAGDCKNKPTVAYKTCETCGDNFAPDADKFEETALESIYGEIEVPAENAFDGTTVVIGPDSDRYADFDGAHKWILVGVAEPTCFATGIATWRCENCPKYTYEILDPTNHADAEKIQDAVKADCQNDGWEAHAQCPDCGLYFAINEDGTIDLTEAYPNDQKFVVTVDPTNHVDKREYLGRDATCDGYGYDAYNRCRECDAIYYGEQNDADNLGATYSEVRRDRTLLRGYVARHLDTPDESFTFVEAKDPTCTVAGNVEHYLCEECDITYVFDGTNYVRTQRTHVVLPALGHDYTDDCDCVKLTCGQDGYLPHFHCEREVDGVVCGMVFDENKNAVTLNSLFRTADTVEHQFNIILQEKVPCTEEKLGVAGLYECDVCGYQVTVDPHNYTDKTYEGVEGTRRPTCTEGGIYALKCEHCQALQKTDDGKGVMLYEEPKIAHTDYGTPTYVKAVAATCFTDGNYAYYVCNGCDGKFSSALMLDSQAYINGAEIIKAAHADVVPHVGGNVPECGKVEVAQFFCTVCEKYSEAKNMSTDAESDTLSDTPHTGDNAFAHTNAALVKDYTKATCTTKGTYTVYQCADCGDIYYIDLDDNCHAIDDVADAEIELVPHDGKFVPAKKPTCTESGWAAHYEACSICGLSYYAVNLDATTKEEAGLNTEKLWKDFHVEAPLGHVQTPDNTVAHKAPVCNGVYTTVGGKVEYTTTDGNIAYYTCDACGKNFKDGETRPTDVALTDETIKAVYYPEFRHTMTATEIDSKDNTCTTVGYSAMQCTCGFTYYQLTAPLGHKVVAENTTKIEATCSTTGLHVYYFCKNCLTSYTDAACTEVLKSYEGMTYTEALDAVKADAIIPATGVHVNIDAEGNKTAIEAGCYNGPFVETENGWIENIVDRECDECGKEFTKAHDWVSGHVDANCSYPVSDYYYCSICHVINENTRVVIGEKNPDKHPETVQKVTEGTNCDSEDRFYDECVLCGKQVGDSYADAEGHDYEEAYREDATCTESGKLVEVCNKCGDEKTTELKPTGKHIYGDWTDVPGMENNYTSDKAEVRYCTGKNCDAKEYQAHQDVQFSISMDSAITPDDKYDVVYNDGVVNSGKVAVTITMSAYNKMINAHKLTFKYSDNLIFDSIVFAADYATGYNVEHTGNGEGGVVTLFSILYNTDDYLVNGQDIVYATIYFNVDMAEVKEGAAVEVYDLTVVDLLKFDGSIVEATVRGEGKATESVYLMGDLDGDFDVDVRDAQLYMTLVRNSEYDARGDFNKDGKLTVAEYGFFRQYMGSMISYEELIGKNA